MPTPRPPVPKPRGRVPVNRSGEPAEWDTAKGEWINVSMKGRGRDTWEVCPRCFEPTEYLDDCYEPVVICENKHCRDEYHLHCAGFSALPAKSVEWRCKICAQPGVVNDDAQCELVATRGAETRERRPEPGLPSQVRDWSRGVPAPG